MFSLSLVDQARTKITNFNLINTSQSELRFTNKRYYLTSLIFHHGQGLTKDIIHLFYEKMEIYTKPMTQQ